MKSKVGKLRGQTIRDRFTEKVRLKTCFFFVILHLLTDVIISLRIELDDT